MLFKIVVGALVGMWLGRMAMWRFARHRCRRDGWHGGPWRLLHAIRALGLDTAQRAHVKDIMIELKRFGTELRFARFDAREELSAALGGDAFDRARLEALAQRQQEAFGRARQSVIDHLEALHASLTEEQKTKLRDLLGDRQDRSDPVRPHPYR